MGLFDDGPRPHDDYGNWTGHVRGGAPHDINKGDGCPLLIVSGIAGVLATGIAGQRGADVVHDATREVVSSTQSPAMRAAREQAEADIARAKALESRAAEIPSGPEQSDSGLGLV